jgi:hypothetical protein
LPANSRLSWHRAVNLGEKGRKVYLFQVRPELICTFKTPGSDHFIGTVVEEDLGIKEAHMKKKHQAVAVTALADTDALYQQLPELYAL